MTIRYPSFTLSWSLALATLWTLQACDAPKSAEASSSPAAPAAQTAPAAKGQMAALLNQDQHIKSRCIVQSQSSVKIKPEVGGRIESVLKKQGEQVRQGEVLASINTVDLEMELERLRVAQQGLLARQALLVSQLESARQVWQKLSPLYADSLNGAMPREQAAVREKQLELELVKTELAEHALRIKRTARQIQLSTLRSPSDGAILLRNAEVGMIVVPGAMTVTGSDVLFEIANPMKLRLECAVRENDSQHLQVGKPITVTLNSDERHPLNLRISSVSPTIQHDGGASVQQFWADFDKPPTHNIIAGMHASAALQVSSKP